MKAFVSSVIEGLERERDEITKAIGEVGITCYQSEKDYQIASGEDIVKYFDRLIADSQFLVTIIGKRYGEKKYSNLTATEQEFESAIRKQARGEHIEILVFVLDGELEEGNKQFIKRIEGLTTPPKYAKVNRENLVGNVIKSITKSLVRLSENPEGEIDDIISEKIDDWTDSYQIIGRSGKLLLLAIPERIRSDYIKLFGENREFIGNEKFLTTNLFKCFNAPEYSAKPFSDGFGLFYKRKGSMLEGFSTYRSEAKIYHTGMVEIGLELANQKLYHEEIKKFIERFFIVINEIYREFQVKDRIIFSFNIVNADKIKYVKNPNKIMLVNEERIFKGEEYTYSSRFHISFEDNGTKRNKIVERILNEIDNFCNEPIGD